LTKFGPRNLHSGNWRFTENPADLTKKFNLIVIDNIGVGFSNYHKAAE